MDCRDPCACQGGKETVVHRSEKSSVEVNWVFEPKGRQRRDFALLAATLSPNPETNALSKIRSAKIPMYFGIFPAPRQRFRIR